MKLKLTASTVWTVPKEDKEIADLLLHPDTPTNPSVILDSLADAQSGNWTETYSLPEIKVEVIPE